MGTVDNGIQANKAHNQSTSNMAQADRKANVFDTIDTEHTSLITASEFQAAVHKSLLGSGAALRVAAAREGPNDGVPPTMPLLAMLGMSKAHSNMAAPCTAREVQESEMGAGWV